jgi:hypothetical protein
LEKLLNIMFFCTDGKISVRINLPLFSTVVPVDDVVITTKGLKDRNIHIIDGTTVGNKGKLILLEKLLESWVLERKQYT